MILALPSFSSRSCQKHVVSTLFVFYRKKSLSTSTQQFHHSIKRKKQKLQPHHAQEIIDDYNNIESSIISRLSSKTPPPSPYDSSKTLLFHDFVQTVCSTSTIPRKELYEAWSSALIIHGHFPHVKRIADLACGHGLLSWSLLILDYSSNKNHHHHDRTAVCIDRRMPQSAEKIAQAMITKWPELETKWDFVECKLDSIIPSSSTLLCGIHPCGILSDQIVSLAIQGNAPLALMPCCHAKKSLNDEERFTYNNSIVKNKASNDIGSNINDGSQSDRTLSLSEYIDKLRMERLESFDYVVTETFIPKEYTPQNKLILAKPSKMNTKMPCNADEDDAYYNMNSLDNSVTRFFQQAKQQQFVSRSHTPLAHPIPIGNDIESISTVKRLSGRAQAEKRKAPPPPSLCVSMFMPKSITITPDILLSTAGHIWDCNKVQIDYADDGPYLHPNGLLARTFCITYLEENRRRVEKERAKQLHDEFCSKIVNLIEDIQIRR
jgi:hypothetical protein